MTMEITFLSKPSKGKISMPMATMLIDFLVKMGENFYYLKMAHSSLILATTSKIYE